MTDRDRVVHHESWGSGLQDLHKIDVWPNPLLIPEVRPFRTYEVAGTETSPAATVIVGRRKSWWQEQIDELRWLIWDRARLRRIMARVRKEWYDAGGFCGC